MKKKKRLTFLMSGVLFLSSINVPPTALHAETKDDTDAPYIDENTVSGEALEVMADDGQTDTTDTEDPTAPPTSTEEDKIYFDAKTGTITGCDKALTELVIPETINGVTVNVIGEGAFINNTTLQSVIIPDCVTEIGKNAFYKCTALKTVKTGEGVTKIGLSAFYCCTALESIDIGASVEIIDDYAFYDCDDLKEVTGMEGVREIGLRAFYSDYRLSSVPLGDSLEVLEDYAFASYIKFDKLPPNLKRIGAESINVESEYITIPASVEYMNDGAIYSNSKTCRVYIFEGDDVQFEGEKPITTYEANEHIVASSAILNKLSADYAGIIHDKDNIKFVDNTDALYLMDKSGETLYYALPKAEKLQLPGGLKTIGNYALYNFSGDVKEIVVPEGVESIGDYGIYGRNYAALSVELPKSLQSIGYSFANKDYTQFYCIRDSYAEKFLSENSYKYHYQDSIINFDCGEYSFRFETEFGKILSYEGTLPEELVIPDEINGVKVRAIEDKVFQSTKLKSVTLPETVVIIPSSAFSSAQMLETVIAPGVVQIEDNAFDGCKLLKNIEFSPDLQTIGAYAFRSCSALESFSGKNVTEIGRYAFYNCYLMQSVSLPCVSAVPSYCFYECSRLVEVDMPAITSIAEYAFSYTGRLKFSGTKELKQIEYYAFYGSDIESFGANELLTTIGNKAFDSDVLLYGYENSVIINYAIKNKINYRIVDKSFALDNSSVAYPVEGGNIYFNEVLGEISGCDKTVTKVVIPEKINGVDVTAIGAYAFTNCNSLTEVTIPDNITKIGVSAFRACQALESLVIPASVTALGDGAIIGECNELKSVEISSDILSDENRVVIYNCQNLEEIKLNEGVTNVAFTSIRDVKNLKRLILPKSLQTFKGINSSSNVLVSYYAGTTFTKTSYARYCVDNSEVIELKDGKIYVDKATGAVTGAEGTFTEATIPETINGVQIKSIDDYAFNNIDTLRKLTIESTTLTVTKGFVGKKIAIYCKHNSAVEETCKNAKVRFSYCDYVDGIECEINGIKMVFDDETQTITRVISAPEALVFPEEINGVQVKVIGSDVFYLYNTGTVKSITIPDTVEEIAQNAFAGCAALESVEIGNGVKMIGNSAFSNCAKLKELTMGSSVEEIGSGAFASCVGLTEVNLGNKLTTIGSAAFAGCAGLTKIDIGDSVTTIGSSAFINCTGAEEINIGNGVTTIGSVAFSSCTNAKKLTLGDSVTTIDYNAFSSCESLVDVVFGKSKVSLGSNAFSYCGALENLDFNGGFTKIDSYAFSGCSKLENLVFDCDIDEIGSNIVSYSGNNLKTITFSGNVGKIGNSAFSGCNNLVSVDITGNVDLIDNYAFSGCNNLQTVNMSGSVKNIGNYAFNYCSNLESLTLSKSLQSIGEYAFYGAKIKKFELTGDNLAIGNDAFYYCQNLEEVTIGDGVLSVGNYAFSSNSKLEKVVIGDSLKSIGYGAFNNCPGLKTVIIGNGVTEIGESAFSNYNSIVDLTIGNSVETIGNSAFSGLVVEEVVLPESVKRIGSYAFGGCFKKITVGGNIEEVGNGAFNGYGANGYRVIFKTMGGTLGDNLINDRGEIYCYKGSVMQNYAEANDYTYYLLDDIQDIDELFAKTKVDGGYIYYKKATGRITGVDNTVENLIIPEVAEDGTKITAINKGAFAGNTNLKTVVIPDTVTEIGSNAFSNCSALESVEIGNGITAISDYAFSYCKKLRSVKLSDSVETIGVSAFSNTGLRSIVLGENITTVSNSAFIGCYLKNAIIKNDNITLGEDCFATSSSSTAVNTPVRLVANEGSKAKEYSTTNQTSFQNLADLSAYAVEGGNIYIDKTNGEIVLCEDSVTVADIPNVIDGVTVSGISSWAFANHTKVKKIVVPETVGYLANLNTSSAETIRICNNDITLGDGAISTSNHVLLEVVKNSNGHKYAVKQGIAYKLFNVVDISTNNGGTASLTGKQWVADGDGFTVEATADAGYKLANAVVTSGNSKKLYNGADAQKISFDSLSESKNIKFNFAKDNETSADLIVEQTSLSLEPNNKTQITYKTNPAIAGDIDVVFVSENPEIAIVGDDGTVYAKGLGETYISVYSSVLNKTIKVAVKVYDDEMPVLESAPQLEFISANSVKFNWAEASDNFAVAEYEISRNGEVIATTTEGTLLDTNLVDNTEYTYEVVAIDKAGNRSDATTLTVTTMGINSENINPFPATGSIFGDVASKTIGVAVDERYINGAKLAVYISSDNGETFEELEEKYIRGIQVIYDTKMLVANLPVNKFESGDYVVKYVVTDASGVQTSETVNYAVDKIAPSAPTGFTAIDGVAVELMWDEVEDSDVAGYKVYRMTNADSGYKCIFDTESKNILSYSDSTVSTGVYYKYVVAAYDILGNESELSDSVFLTVKTDTEAPKILGINIDNDSTITQGATIGGVRNVYVRAYDNIRVAETTLYYSLDGENWLEFDKKQSSSKETTASFNVDVASYQSDKIYFKAECTDSYGNKSAQSDIYMFNVDYTKPTKITGLKADPQATIINLAWDDIDDEDFSHFWVEEKVDGKFVVKQSINDKRGCNFTNLVPESTYIYRVCAVDVYGNKGEYSDELTVVTPKDTSAPIVVAMKPTSAAVNNNVIVEVSTKDDYLVSAVELEYSYDGETWATVGNYPIEKPSINPTKQINLNVSQFNEGLVQFRAIPIDSYGNRGSEKTTVVQYKVDYTAPNPLDSLSITGDSNAINLKWDATDDTALAYYRVYYKRDTMNYYSTTGNKIFSTNYTFTNPSPEHEYSFYVTVVDDAGNESEPSNTATIYVSKDTVKPEVKLVSPETDSELDIRSRITISATDDLNLSRIYLEYKDSRGYWQAVAERECEYGVTEDTLETGLADFDTDTLEMRAYAKDRAGNKSDEINFSYKFNLNPPTVKDFAVTPDIESVKIHADVSENDGVIYAQLFRKCGNEKYGTYGRAEVKDGIYDFTDENVSSDKVYTYKLQITNSEGRFKNVYANNVKPLPKGAESDKEPPKAGIVLEKTIQKSVSTTLSAAASTDNYGIKSYKWIIDGTTELSGKTTNYIFATGGEHTVRLIVTDYAGNTNEQTVTVDVYEKETMGTVKIKLNDNYGMPTKGVSLFINFGSEDQEEIETDENGECELTLPGGDYIIGIYGDGYLPTKKTITVKNGVYDAVEMITITKKNIVTGTITHKKLSLEEAEKLGIDLTSEENKYAYEYTIQIEGKSYKKYAKSDGKTTSFLDGNTFYIKSEEKNAPDKQAQIFTFGQPKEDKSPSVMVLIMDLPGSVTWTKDFFEVSLSVVNEADAEYVIDDSVVKLNVPDGLSLMQLNGYQGSDTKEIGELVGGKSDTTNWILRGDKQGEYGLKAVFTGTLRGFNEPLRFEFNSAEPLEVSNGKNFAMMVKYEKQASGDFAYALRVGVKNKGDESMSAPEINLGYAEKFQQFKQNKSGNFVPVDGKTILPGETVWADFVVPRENYESVYKTITEYLDTHKVVTSNKMNTANFKKASILSGNDDLIMESTANEIKRFEICKDEFTFYKMVGGRIGGEMDQMSNIVDNRIDGKNTAEIPAFAIKVTRRKFDGSVVALRNEQVEITEPGKSTPVIKTTDNNGFVYIDPFVYDGLTDSYDIEACLVNIKVKTDRGTDTLGAPIIDSRIGQAEVDGELYFELEEKGITVPAANVQVTIDEVTATTDNAGKFNLTTKSKKGNLEVKVEGEVEGRRIVRYFRYDFKDKTELRQVIKIKAAGEVPVIQSRSVTVAIPGSATKSFDKAVFIDGLFDGKATIVADVVNGELFSDYVYVNNSAKLKVVSPDGTVKEFEAKFNGDKDFDYFSRTHSVEATLDIAKDIPLNSKVYFELSVAAKDTGDRETITGEMPVRNVKKPNFLYGVDGSFAISAEEPDYTFEVGDLEFDFSDLVDEINDAEVSKNRPDASGSSDKETAEMVGSTVDKTGREFSLSSVSLDGTVGYDLAGNFTFELGAGAGGSVEPAGFKLENEAGSVDSFDVSGNIGYAHKESYNLEKDVWEVTREFELGAGGEIEDIPIAAVSAYGIATAYIKLDASMYAKLRWAFMDENAAETNGQVLPSVVPNEISDEFTVKGKFGASLVDIGSVSLADVGAYLELSPTLAGHNLITRDAYMDIIVGLEAGAYAGFLWFKVEGPFWQPDDWTIFDSRWITDKENEQLTALSVDDKVFALAMAEPDKQWLGGSLESKLNILESGAYSSNGIRVIKLDDGRRLAVFADFANGGTDVNSIRNMYSIYSNGQWSTPQVICEDGTPDIQPTLVKTDSGARLMWINANDSLASDKMESIETLQADYADKTDLWQIDFDATSNTWATPACVTANSTGFKYLPKYANNGKSSMTAYLASNTLAYNADDPVRIEYIYRDENDEVVSGGAINIPVANVMDIELGYDANGYKLAYTDGVSGKLYLTSFNGTSWTYPSTLNTNATTQSSPVFVNGVDGDLLLYYVNGNAIYAKSVTDDSSEVIMIENKFTENAVDYDIFVEADKNAMVWQNSGNQLLLSYYDSQNECYGKGVEITDIAANEFISDINVTFDDDGAIVVYTRKTILKGGKLTANIESVFLPYSPDLAVGGVKYLSTSAPAQQTSIGFDVSNLGISTSTGYTAYISASADGSNSIAQYDSADKIISGDTAYGEISFTMPATNTPLYLVVESKNGDIDSLNNSVALTDLYKNMLKVTKANVLEGMGNELMVQVENNSAWASGNFAIKAYEVRSRQVIANKTVDGLAAFKDAEYALDLGTLDDENYNENGKALIYVVAESTDAENPVEYSSYLMTLRKDDGTTSVVSSLAVETYNLIESIGEVTLEDKATIEQAEENLAKLTSQVDIDYVTNKDKLVEARKQLDELLKSSQVSQLAIDTYNLIESIGEVTIEDKATIEQAEENLAKLTAQVDIDYVTNKDKLVEARTKLNELLKDKTKFMYGDVDYDGIITAADASTTLQHALIHGSVGFTADTEVRADVSGDKVIDAYDAAMILQKTLNGSYKFPVEDSDENK